MSGSILNLGTRKTIPNRGAPTKAWYSTTGILHFGGYMRRVVFFFFLSLHNFLIGTLGMRGEFFVSVVAVANGVLAHYRGFLLYQIFSWVHWYLISLVIARE